ncbi:MAG: 23S rRNA (adenine(2503)-C(2))-methyltransferase RlmN [Deltaproteobacteria bacterium]|nr:23S rRNA (adenine(2503)-C(2))-methyltransferase RlmN [Deltaproteobacteria bacterium]
MMPDLKNMTFPELETWAAANGEPRYRAHQLMKWMYCKEQDDPDAMTDIPKAFREKLKQEARISRLEPFEIQKSKDGTRKFLFRLDDGEFIETVLIQERDHMTLCVSTQVGCAMGCAFCLTGGAGFKRDLGSAEIVNQILAVKRRLDPGENLTNLVFMGMGEPLLNYENTVRALDVVMDNRGLAFSQRHVTVSTSGIAHRILPLGNRVNVGLAVSLNAADDETRSALMPINRKYPLSTLLDACRRYPLKRGRRITYEYILIEGVNDSTRDAENLVRLLHPGQSKINLIPLNEHAGCSFRSPEPGTVEGFQAILIRNHFTAIVRKSKGQDIMAACGQLAGKHAKDS